MNPEIFIVEDESIVALEIQDRVKALGYGIAGTASSGEEALDKLTSCSADLIIMDIRLKGQLDGIETAGLIKQRFDLPVIFLTAYADENTLQRAKITEPYAYIIKPFEERELHTNIEIALYKHRADKEIKEKDQWLSVILRSIGDGVIATDKDKKIVFMNEVAERLTRYRTEESIGKDLGEIFKLLNGYTGEQIKDPAAEVLKYCKLVTFNEYATLVSRYGSLRPVIGTAAPIKDQHNQAIGIVLVFQDMSERAKAEAAVKESEKKFKAIVENSPGLVYLFSTKRGGLYYSPRAYDILFYSVRELLDNPHLFFDSVGESERGMIFKMMLGTKENEVISFEHKIKDARNNWKWLDTRAVCIEKIGDELIFQCVANDITEKKITEEKIALQASALNSAFNGIMITDSDGTIVYCNNSQAVMTGYTKEELLDENPRIFKSGLQDQKFYAKMWQSIKSGSVWHGELINRKKDGTLYYEDITITPVKDADGNITHFVAIKQDVSERKKFESELLAAKEEAEKSSRMKTEFLAHISHEIRTPVNNMVSFANFIASELQGKIDEDLQTGFDAIDRGGKRLIRTIELLLNMSSVQSGSYVPKPKKLNIVDDIMLQVISEYERIAEIKGLTVEFEDQLDGRNNIIGDEYSITQIFMNLLDNAVKFTSHGKIVLNLSHDDETGKTIVRVIDTGIGIAGEYMSNLFNPFTQEDDGITRSYEGNGLGLSLVKKYCEINNAGIEVQSSKGRGSIFSVIFETA